jgi:hypothetical protein
VAGGGRERGRANRALDVEAILIPHPVYFIRGSLYEMYRVASE